jgi:glutamate synthase (NADPH/NADH) small chain
LDILSAFGVNHRNGLADCAPGSYQTSNPKVFAAGEIQSGGSSIVASMASGMKAAREAHAWLGQQGVLHG